MATLPQLQSPATMPLAGRVFTIRGTMIEDPDSSVQPAFHVVLVNSEACRSVGVWHTELVAFIQEVPG